MPRPTRLPKLRPFWGGIIALPLLAACEKPIDFDLRGFGGGFSTAEAAQAAAARPAPDARGVITYPNYQVVVAQQGDTVRTIATRLGLDAEALARHNGISADAVLRRDELIALPTTLTPLAAAPAATDITAVATTALDRAGDVSTAALPAAATAPAQPFVASGPEPIRHQVQRGETAYSIARLYGVPVETIAAWNSLGPDLAVREGQQLLVPQSGSTPAPAAAVVTPPGSGSETPVPPSAATPLPDEVPPPAAAAGPDDAAASPAPDLGAEQTVAPAASAYAYPVQGSIIRAYAPGRNEGIDIAAAAGTEVRAAASGTVAAITTNTEGIQIVVIRHGDGLLSVYTHVEGLTVAKDQAVSQGQVIGRVRAGDPSFLHFEIRQGMQSRDPAEYLP